MSEGCRERLVEYLRDAHGARLPWRASAGRRQKAVLDLHHGGVADGSTSIVAPFVHPSMDYKLLPRLPGSVRREPQFVEPS